MTARTRVGTALRRWTIVHRFVLVIIAIRLLYMADRRLDSLAARQLSPPPFNRTSSFAFDSPVDDWFIASGIILLAGIALGSAARSRPPGTRFRPGTVALLGLGPLLLAMTYAMIWWEWPGSRWVPWLPWRTHFYHDPLSSIMWLFVGVAIAAGFERSEAGPSSPDHPGPVEE